MRHLKTVLAVLGAVTILVLAGNTIALATTGHSFILGKSNSANKTTGLSRTTSGTVLNLHSKSGSNAPLSVNGKGKVANLNADLLDGLDSADLRTHGYVFRSSFSGKSAVVYTLPVPKGTYLVSYSGEFQGATVGSYIACRIQEIVPSATRDTGVSSTQVGTVSPAAGGSGVVTKSPGGSLDVVCQVNASTFDTNIKSQLEIVVTPIHVTSLTTISPDP